MKRASLMSVQKLPVSHGQARNGMQLTSKDQNLSKVYNS